MFHNSLFSITFKESNAICYFMKYFNQASWPPGKFCFIFNFGKNLIRNCIPLSTVVFL